MWSLLCGGGIFTKFAMIALCSALVILAGYSMVKTGQLVAARHEIAGLEVKVSQLQTDNATLKHNVETITKVNEMNVETNNKLIEERNDAQAAIAELAKAQTSNRKRLADGNKRVDDLLKDPNNNGTVSPVLRNTIKSIQAGKK